MCDCGRQIDAGVGLAASQPGGTLVYMPQEGRNYGLLSKVEIMRQMNSGLSLEAAQRAVGRPETRLSYDRIPELLDMLGLSRPVTLLTTSTAKVRAVTAAGVRVERSTSLVL
jgi:GTP cyclohydrolase II